jgi:hypothetical protein
MIFLNFGLEVNINASCVALNTVWPANAPVKAVTLQGCLQHHQFYFDSIVTR